LSARCAGLFSRFCRALLRLAGWKVVLVRPPGPKAVVIVYPHTSVVIVYPHTSNWDFIVGILARYAIAIPFRFVGKDTLFRWPFGGLFRRLGGIPVNRRQSTGFVGDLIEAFDKADSLYLAIAPEGTRRRIDHWKSGFYRVALAAGGHAQENRPLEIRLLPRRPGGQRAARPGLHRLFAARSRHRGLAVAERKRGGGSGGNSCRLLEQAREKAGNGR